MRRAGSEELEVKTQRSRADPKVRKLGGKTDPVIDEWGGYTNSERLDDNYVQMRRNWARYCSVLSSRAVFPRGVPWLV
jgi:hypothetical protein